MARLVNQICFSHPRERRNSHVLERERDEREREVREREREKERQVERDRVDQYGRTFPTS